MDSPALIIVVNLKGDKLSTNIKFLEEMKVAKAVDALKPIVVQMVKALEADPEAKMKSFGMGVKS